MKKILVAAINFDTMTIGLGLVIFWCFVQINLGVVAKRDILEKISQGTDQLLQNPSVVPLQLTEAVQEINDIRNKTVASDTICKTCETVVNKIIDQWKDNASKENLTEGLKALCKVYTTGGSPCEGYVNIQIDTILYILNNKKDLKGARVCAIRLQQYNCTDPDAEPWSIPLPPPTQVKLKLKTDRKKGTNLNVLHLTDFHYDREYVPGSNANCDEPLCCQTGTPTNSSNAAGFWGDYKVCDMPRHSVENLMKRIKHKHANVDFVYFTGDIVSHKSWASDIENNSESIKLIFSLLDKNLPNKTVYPILGNHEPHPSDFFSPNAVTDNSRSSIISTQWLFDLSAEVWTKWLPNNTKATIKKGGFYTVLVNPRFRIIALNNNVCFTSNLWLIYADEDPYDQLKWLVDILEQSERNGEKVHILAHIPPGEVSCHRQWSHQYKRIVLRFAKTISAQFNGHTHLDELRIFYDTSDYTRTPKNLAFNGGSFTTFVGYNPNYRIYEVDSVSNEVVNFHQFIYNLTEANANPNSPPKWFKLYSFKEAYGLKDLKLSSLGELYRDMINNSDPEIIDKYYKYMVRESDGVSKECDSTCKRNLICSISAVETSQRLLC